jgi:prepilin-type N-terminal cleavage/methylation domain-containing protein
MKKLLRRSRGFTLVELLIATSIFSVFLLLITTMIIRIGQIYTKGLVTTQTEEAARAISTEITRAVEFSSSTPSFTSPSGSTPGHICAGSSRYSFYLHQELVDNSPASDQRTDVLTADTSASCPGGAASTRVRELMPVRTRLLKLNLTLTGALYTLTIRVGYGDKEGFDDYTSPNAVCLNEASTSAFCATSELTTSFQKRL